MNNERINQIAQTGIGVLQTFPGLAATWRITNTEDGPFVYPINPGAKLMAGRMANLDGEPPVSRAEMVAAFGKVAQWIAHYPSSQRMFETMPIKDDNGKTGARYTAHPVPQEPVGT